MIAIPMMRSVVHDAYGTFAMANAHAPWITDLWRLRGLAGNRVATWGGTSCGGATRGNATWRRKLARGGNAAGGEASAVIIEL
ncbi:hypothetical protein DF200_07025 [Bifidobacterium catulorum]|uniref:Uncharacterized protein n=1 Tax=Bifidobacterium catulorum TaxID=1630173 RepID=A0A2U2MRQ1_9BIFI|nr:hypothetical protein DF200_07025 [Bifidobacterium catulorum]